MPISPHETKDIGALGSNFLHKQISIDLVFGWIIQSFLSGPSFADMRIDGDTDRKRARFYVLSGSISLSGAFADAHNIDIFSNIRLLFCSDRC